MGESARRVRIRVTGTVQGVGFRPFVYRVARELGLAGYVLNDERGVVIEVEGGHDAVSELAHRVKAEAPALAQVEAVDVEEGVALGESGFRIADSPSGGTGDAPVSPDVATCDACLAELFDPQDRRFRYPFINCTDCGPRFTIVKGVPYDRQLTTMAAFEMCAACRSEYEDPADRRFHAQPNACADCGPRARLLHDEAEVESCSQDAVARAASLVASGGIVAVKGVGGYHLACDASNANAVASLRSRKRREDKPFALMAPDLARARELVSLTVAEEALLIGHERPILLAPRLADARVAEAVAPRSHDLGVMLPYAPLQHLLLADCDSTVVMTSANVSDEPIAYLDDEARARLHGIADAFLVHDRPIHMRTDDSVVRAVKGRGPLMLRRSRGYVPRAVALPVAAEPVLGCGAELKNTFCLARGDRAWVGHHIGDLGNWETLRSFKEGIEHFQRLFAVEPLVVAHDLHPDYLSTRYALEREEEGARLVGVQHHHAHLAACLAEHGEAGPAVGAIFDGTGYGTDGTIWGGEILSGGLEGFERVGMIMPVRLPGGDRAVKEPWRMAASWLAHSFDEELPAVPRHMMGNVDPDGWEAVCSLVQTGIGSPVTTSAGRLFDAFAAICGIRTEVNYEGQAAAELEGIADPHEKGTYDISLEGGEGGPLVIDPRAAVRSAVDDLERGEEVKAVAARFHNALAAATAATLVRECDREGIDLVVLSGGVLQNGLFCERALNALEGTGLRVLLPLALPPNDGGIAYGQVAVAAAIAA